MILQQTGSVHRSVLLASSVLAVLLCIGQVSAAEPADQEALANERFPVNSQRIEAQWGVDCDAAIEEADSVAEVEAMAAGGSTQQHLELRETLQLCGFIYNTPDSQLYRRCPLYRQWAAWLGGEAGMPNECQ